MSTGRRAYEVSCDGAATAGHRLAAALLPGQASLVVDQYRRGNTMIGQEACEAAKTAGAAVVPKHRARAACAPHAAQARGYPGRRLE
jgi:hypothetical protein